MSTSPTRGRRVALVAGLVAGLGLGVNGLASAASTTPTTPPSGAAGQPGHGPRGDHGHGRGDRGPRHGAGGLVTAVTGTQLTVDTPRGPKTVALTPATTYRHGRATATRTDVKVGEIVRVRVRLVDPAATAAVAKAVEIEPAHVGGFVSAVDGSTLKVVDESGFTRTIRTSSSTTYEKDGAAAKASALTVGSFVRAEGVVDPDGTTLDAARVATGHPARPAGAPGGKAGNRPAGGPANGPADAPAGGPADAPADGLDAGPGIAPNA